MKKTIYSKKSLSGTITVPGDKSISHRAVMFGSIAEGVTEIKGFLTGDDCMSTIACFKKLGVDIEIENNNVKVYGNGLHGLSKPKGVLDVGNSGTTIRLISGILAAQPFSCEITGDSSIQKRPMKRVIEPLSLMGAKIKGLRKEGFAPLVIEGARLKAIEYELPVASAQVKSAILLASLFADDVTTIIEPTASRNHTEIMLNYFGANIKNINGKIISSPVKQLYGKPVYVPADISSAAFFIVAGLIVPDSDIIIENVGVNITRTGIIDALKSMGGDIELINENNDIGEAVADIRVRTSKLHSITLEGEIIPRMIDEIPVFSVAALFADGVTVIKNAEELKVKESNRIATMTKELCKMGADVRETDDGMIINGNASLVGSEVESYNDHRVAMSLAVAALMANNKTIINNAECVAISFPAFFDFLEKL